VALCHQSVAPQHATSNPVFSPPALPSALLLMPRLMRMLARLRLQAKMEVTGGINQVTPQAGWHKTRPL
jgi:hypothetical protein